MPHAAPLLALTAIPADLRAALLAAGHAVADLSAQPEGPLPGFRIAVTTALVGCAPEVFARLPDLGLVVVNGAGLDRIDLGLARARGVAVVNTADALTEDVADFAIALLYGIARRVAEMDRFVRAGAWAGARPSPSTRLLGKTCGIFGLGRIGQAVARRAEGIGMRVVWSGPRPRAGEARPYLPDLGALAEAADALVLCCPGGAATAGIVDAAVLRRLGPQGWLINIARGSVVQEEALIAALRTGGILGAGLDVFATEPRPDARFLELPNVVLAPHYASLTHETRAAMIADLLAGIAAFQAGAPLRDAAA
jgi:lactate dehydrogenase-like 2-hydroxyacid dehydrogenase